ncbi:hypothetical protein BDN70DRAFT_896479 [Pholiota conissans]|uniref:Uncharacterized protein n=1 Tax=Pholiota conissans TaxID=109636 RepID=A0A9P5YXE4_9AGAR|nr:hypothetical protein BDN70DRAFT_896479 [Pholiota conissans]
MATSPTVDTCPDFAGEIFTERINTLTVSSADKECERRDAIKAAKTALALEQDALEKDERRKNKAKYLHRDWVPLYHFTEAGPNAIDRNLASSDDNYYAKTEKGEPKYNRPARVFVDHDSTPVPTQPPLLDDVPSSSTPTASYASFKQPLQRPYDPLHYAAAQAPFYSLAYHSAPTITAFISRILSLTPYPSGATMLTHDSLWPLSLLLSSIVMSSFRKFENFQPFNVVNVNVNIYNKRSVDYSEHSLYLHDSLRVDARRVPSWHLISTVMPGLDLPTFKESPAHPYPFTPSYDTSRPLAYPSLHLPLSVQPPA